MNARRARAGLVLVLTVASLGAAGAAIDSDASGGASAGSGEGSGTGIGQGQNGISTPPDINPLFDGGLIATFIGVVAVLGMATAVVGCVYALLVWDWDRLRKFLVSAAAKVTILGVVALVFYLFISAFPDLSGGGSSGISGEGAAEGMGTAAESAGIDFPMFLGALALMVVLVVVAVVITRSDDEDGPAVEPPSEEPGDRSPSPPGDAGANAPRSAAGGRVPADNEVYRSWLALADAAGADAGRDTPADVAESAVDRGVDERAVAEITELFEAVRYGQTSATDAHERRAASARERLASER